MQETAAIAATLDRPFTFADVGARWGPQDAWRQLAPPIQIVAFEADPAECERLAVADESGAVRYEPVALGARRGPATLYMTRDPACSSLYPPEPAVVERLPELQAASLVGERTVELDTLDGWCEANGVTFDALKLDVQGAELDVLAGAVGQLEHVVAVELEVEFNAIYTGQPLFADVDRFLRGHGFRLWRLGNFCHYSPHRSAGPVGDEVVFVHPGGPDGTSMIRRDSVEGLDGQLFWGHAHYVAADVLDGAGGDRARRGVVAAGGFGFPDLAAVLQETLEIAPLPAD